MTLIDGINIDSLLKAFSKFDEFRQHTSTEQEKAGTIHAFEYCFELTWKTMKRLLNVRGQIANSPREVIRLAALENFIDDPERWFDFLKKRNMTTHTYDEKEAEAVLSILTDFASEMEIFFDRIKVESNVYRRKTP